MANNGTNKQANVQQSKKLLLSRLFCDAPVRTEPEEPQKVLVAGLAEARPVKDYPDTFFGRGFKVFRGEFGNLFKSSLYTILFTAPFAVILFWFAGYFQNLVLGNVYNFMGGVGVGYPFFAGDSIALSVSSLYWDVKEPIYCMLAAALIIASAGLAGLYYCAKRSFYQDYYKKPFRMYWTGFAKYWWKFLLFLSFAILVGLAIVTSLMNLLAKQQIFTAGAGDYCAVVFAFIFGVPLILLSMTSLALNVSYELTLWQSIKNSIVIFVNNPFSSIIVFVVSLAPLLLLLAGQFMSIIIYILMAILGFAFLSMMWIALVGRGMTKCHVRKEDIDKQKIAEARRKAYESGGSKPKNKQKNKKPPVPYQNPKKKKKK